MSLKITFIAEDNYREVIPEPQLASHSYPEWFSRLERPSKSKCPFAIIHKDNPIELMSGIHPELNTVKNCPGIQDYLNTGYIIPSWDNFIFRQTDNNELYINWTSNFNNNLEVHGSHQFNTMGEAQKPMYGNFFKLDTPWIIRTQPGVSCFITHPYWHRQNHFTSVSGIYNTDCQELSLKWFFEWNFQIKTNLSVEDIDVENQTVAKGDPLLLIIPFHRKSFQKEVKYVSDREYSRLIRKTGGPMQSFKYNDPYRMFRKSIGKLFK